MKNPVGSDCPWFKNDVIRTGITHSLENKGKHNFMPCVNKSKCTIWWNYNSMSRSIMLCKIYIHARRDIHSSTTMCTNYYFLYCSRFILSISLNNNHNDKYLYIATKSASCNLHISDTVDNNTYVNKKCLRVICQINRFDESASHLLIVLCYLDEYFGFNTAMH